MWDRARLFSLPVARPPRQTGDESEDSWEAITAVSGTLDKSHFTCLRGNNDISRSRSVSVIRGVGASQIVITSIAWILARTNTTLSVKHLNSTSPASSATGSPSPLPPTIEHRKQPRSTCSGLSRGVRSRMCTSRRRVGGWRLLRRRIGRRKLVLVEASSLGWVGGSVGEVAESRFVGCLQNFGQLKGYPVIDHE